MAMGVSSFQRPSCPPSFWFYHSCPRSSSSRPFSAFNKPLNHRRELCTIHSANNMDSVPSISWFGKSIQFMQISDCARHSDKPTQTLLVYGTRSPPKSTAVMISISPCPESSEIHEGVIGEEGSTPPGKGTDAGIAPAQTMRRKFDWGAESNQLRKEMKNFIRVGYENRFAEVKLENPLDGSSYEREIDSRSSSNQGNIGQSYIRQKWTYSLFSKY